MATVFGFISKADYDSGGLRVGIYRTADDKPALLTDKTFKPDLVEHWLRSRIIDHEEPAISITSQENNAPVKVYVSEIDPT
jgi:hypothetical protein